MISFKLLSELAYEGNVGIHELMVFYKDATSKQVELLEALLKRNKISKAIRLIEKVTGMKLQEASQRRYTLDDLSVNAKSVLNQTPRDQLTYLKAIVTDLLGGSRRNVWTIRKALVASSIHPKAIDALLNFEGPSYGQGK